MLPRYDTRRSEDGSKPFGAVTYCYTVDIASPVKDGESTTLVSLPVSVTAQSPWCPTVPGQQ